MGNSQVRPATIDEFDPCKYQGKWYEVAKYPNNFQQGCINSTARYKWDNASQKMSVKNTCKLSNGNKTSICGSAAQVNKLRPGQLAVSFDNIKQAGQYWIHWTDYSRYAIVGNASRTNLWILSRESHITSADYSLLKAAVRGFGYNTNRLVVDEGMVGSACDHFNADGYGYKEKGEKVEESENIVESDADHGYKRANDRLVKSESDTCKDSRESEFWHSS